ncbi:VPLPA-CTERM sorting domain-containing protein [Rhodobacteraceae bacterium]|nr:VPLPA-CTERM sorting domain-containing protein [Paracoccaceae bacterium]
MTLKTLAAALCLSMATATTGFAAPINLDFEFRGATGTFFGLDDADGDSSATSFDLFFEPSTFSTVRTTDAERNSFRFEGGDLITANFRIDFDDGVVFDPVSGTDLTNIFIETGFRSEVVSSAAAARLGVGTFTISPVSAVPLPAGGLLLLSGLGGVAALKRRKKRAA